MFCNHDFDPIKNGFIFQKIRFYSICTFKGGPCASSMRALHVFLFVCLSTTFLCVDGRGSGAWRGKRECAMWHREEEPWKSENWKDISPIL
jgi:hypothetical protein